MGAEVWSGLMVGKHARGFPFVSFLFEEGATQPENKRGGGQSKYSVRGPEVSLKGSPTVSPTTAALCCSEPLPPWWPDSIYFLALSQAPPALDINTAMAKPVTDTPPSRPTTPVGPRIRPVTMGNDDGQQSGGHHLMQGALGAQGDAGGIVGIGLAFHDAGDLLELAADLHHDGLGGRLHSAHGEGGEHEGQHGADEHAHQHGGAGQGEVQDLHGRS